jgi:hypothetical protein
MSNNIPPAPTLQFSTRKTVAERQEFKPFGKAVDTVHNKNITTYGEDVFIEYNPMVFLGKKGIMYADAYLKKVITAYAKNEHVTDIIILKSEYADNATFNKMQNSQNLQPNTVFSVCTEPVNAVNNWDWWGDDNINDKINTCELNNNLLNEQNIPNQKKSSNTLIPDVIDKIRIANKLIRELSSFNQKIHDIVTFRNLTLDTVSQPHVHPNATSKVSLSDTSLHSKERYDNLRLGGTTRFEPVRRNINNNTDRQNHTDFDDNYSIRISNFSDPDALTTYAIKDVLYEFMDDIPFKVSIPRNKETNKNKDFAFINFVSEDDLNKAFAQLAKQRIFMDSAILHVEVSKRRNGY